MFERVKAFFPSSAKDSGSLNLLVVVGIIVVANLIVSQFFARIDLTAENRYSLSEVSLTTADSLNYPMSVKVYMEGDFPPNIRQFQDALKATLAELQQYSHGYLDYEFINPTGNKDILAEFQKRGIAPVPVMVRKNAAETARLDMYPVATVRQRDREVYIDLLKGCAKPNGEIDFQQAESDIEYKAVAAIRSILREDPVFVGVLGGHGERQPAEMPEFITELQNAGKNIYTFDMQKQPGKSISPSLEVLLIVQPTERFSERDKYELDQYLMRGGCIFFVLNQEEVNLDLYEKRSTLTNLRDLNLDDLFMQYGFKVNYDLVQDLSCESVEFFQDGANGGGFTSQKWIFSPMVLQMPNHAVCRNTDAVLLRYPSSIDTFAMKGLYRGVFLQTSPYSRTVSGKQFIDVAEYLAAPPPQAMFRQGGRITGLMTEGRFSSLFTGRAVPMDSAARTPAEAVFLPNSTSVRPARMAVISDGEFPLGKLFRGKRRLLPYDNKTLLLNTVDYLAGDQTLTAIRSKEVVERRLDRDKVVRHATLIRVVNIALPLVLIAAFGVVRFWLRKRRNERLRSE